MGKILVTGMNKAQCTEDFFLRQVLNVVPAHYSLIRCLRDMGHEVEQRPVLLGENLDSYDHVIVYAHSIFAYCQRIFGGLYAIAKRPDCVIAFDDWQVDQIFVTFEKYLGELDLENDYAFREYLVSLYEGKESLERIKSFRKDYKTACEQVISRKNLVLIPAFAGGDVSKLGLGWPAEKIFTYNPNPYHLNRTPVNSFGNGETRSTVFGEIEIQKKREWNFSSLVQKKTTKWLKNLRKDEWLWPVTMYGQRVKTSDVKQERLTEDKMCRKYQEQWGCLMPGYFHVGSGWWRARPLQVADAGSILICDEAEGKIFGEAYVGNSVEKIENMSDSELESLASRQKECLYANHPLIKLVTQTELSRVLEKN